MFDPIEIKKRNEEKEKIKESKDIHERRCTNCYFYRFIDDYSHANPLNGFFGCELLNEEIKHGKRTARKCIRYENREDRIKAGKNKKHNEGI